MNLRVQSQVSLSFLLTSGDPETPLCHSCSGFRPEKSLPPGKCQFNWRSKTSMWEPVRIPTSCYQLPPLHHVPGPAAGAGLGG